MREHPWKVHVLVWKRVVPKLLPLFGKAKKLAMWSYVASFADFTEAEMAWAQQFENINELIHGRGALIDLIWMTFVRTIFDQSDDMETWMLRTFVEALVSEYPGVRRSASRWIQNRINEIRRNIGNTYTDDEAETEIRDLGVTEACLEETDKLFRENNIDNIVADGMKQVLNSAGQTLIPALQSRLEHKLLHLEGIKGGNITKQKPTVPRGETTESMAAKIDAADPSSPEIVPPKKGKGRPKGSKDDKPRKERADKGKKRSGSADAKPGKKGADDDEFMAGIDEEAAKSDEES
jgi:hypothetical protein